jgi:periplasmic divalent cation tolerance protein
MVLIYTTCKDTEQAKDLGRKILKARVAACVNVWPMESMYWNDEEIVERAEAVLIIKTSEPKIAEIEEFLEKHHTYSIPFIGTINVHRINLKYREWMSGVLSR